MITVLGIDPGGTTGAALIRWDETFPINEGSVYVEDCWQLEFGQVPGWANEAIHGVNHIAMEKFIISGRTVQATRQYEALYVIGGVLFLCQVALENPRGEVLPEVHLKPASVAKRAWTNDRLTETGLYDKVTGTHARDALRHALLCLHSV